MATELRPPRELEAIRASALRLEVRAADDGEGTEPSLGLMEIHFSPFNQWYEIDSLWEGTFMERTLPGAFRKTIRENGSNVKVLYDHGFDFQVGNKVLGPIESLSEGEDGPIGAVRLMDTSYNRDLLPGLRAGVYGSSFRFQVIRDEWNDAPKPSDYNPKGIPERSIKEVRLYEFGPVTFPASPTASAGMRSITDSYYERLRARDPKVDQMLARMNPRTLPEAIASAEGNAAHVSDTPGADAHLPERTLSDQRQRVAKILFA